MNQNQIRQMMQQAQKMQKDVEKAQKELEKKEYTETAGGGAVEIKMTGAKKMTSLTIKEDVIDPEDKEMLEDMIMLATNNILEKIEKETEEQMGAITGGGLPF